MDKWELGIPVMMPNKLMKVHDNNKNEKQNNKHKGNKIITEERTKAYINFAFLRSVKVIISKDIEQ